MVPAFPIYAGSFKSKKNTLNKNALLPLVARIFQHALLGWGRGVWGWYTWSWGCTWSWRVYLVLGGYLVPGGVTGAGGCNWSQGLYLVWGVYLALGGTWSRECVYLLGGYLVPGGGPAQVLPPVDRMTDRCKNITLAQTWFASGN